MAYDNAFYQGIIAKRRELGSTHGYVDLDACQRAVEGASKFQSSRAAANVGATLVVANVLTIARGG
jgi:hypothetical protein